MLLLLTALSAILSNTGFKSKAEAPITFSSSSVATCCSHAKLLELRAAVSLADLLHREPRSADARQVLAPVYDSFTEGFEFIDLREAKACLDSLSD